MAAIELNDQTAKALQQAAEALGVSVEDFVRSHVLGKPSPTPTPLEERFDFEAEFDKLIFAGPVVRDSREDIYTDDECC